MMPFPVVLYHRRPSILPPAYPINPALVITPSTAVKLVFGARHISKVAGPVIRLIPVDVVYFAGWPLACVNCKSNAMGEKANIEHGTATITETLVGV